jgi:hypothetical protein
MPTVRFLPERTDLFGPFRAAATNVAEAAWLLTDLVTGLESPNQAVARLRELEQRGDEITTRSSPLSRAISLRRLASRTSGPSPASSTTSPTRSTPSASGWRVITCFPRPRWRNA